MSWLAFISSVLPPGKDWIDALEAIATPSIALFALTFAYRSYRLERKRRQDSLFDRRYEFYLILEAWWLKTGQWAEHNQDLHLNPADGDSLAQKAGFIFGPDIAAHIKALDFQGHKGAFWIPEEGFTKPFRKYLELR